MQQKEGELRSVVSLAYKIQDNPLVSVSLKERILKDSTNVKESWDELESAIEERAKRYRRTIVRKLLRN